MIPYSASNFFFHTWAHKLYNLSLYSLDLNPILFPVDLSFSFSPLQIYKTASMFWQTGIMLTNPFLSPAFGYTLSHIIF